jgi:hypothetical protein
MAKSIALWRKNGEEIAKSIALWRRNGEVNCSLAKKGRSQSLFGEEMAKKMAKSIALWRRNGEEYGEVNRSLVK